MLDVLQFVFSSFWVFIGTLMLLSLVVKGVVATLLGTMAIMKGRGVNIQ